jgi:NAD(P)H-dependent FMN reductase
MVQGSIAMPLKLLHASSFGPSDKDSAMLGAGMLQSDGITHSIQQRVEKEAPPAKTFVQAAGREADCWNDLRGMIELVCGTHRPGNNTIKVVRVYAELLAERGVPHRILELAALPSDAFGPRSERHPDIQAWQEERLRPATAMVLVSPEYNGSIPGVLKALIDALDPGLWKGKPILLAGVATGRAGNLRGMDHLSDIMMHLGAWVHPDKLPISSLSGLWEGEGLEPKTRERMGQQIDAFRRDFLAHG